VESQISLAALIQVSRPHTYIKRTFWGVAHWHFLLNELCPQKWQSHVFHSETLSCKPPTNLTVDGCSAQTHAFECLNGPYALLLFSFLGHLQPKELISHEPVQGLNLKCR
jgi:hypothetical protein